MGKVIQLRLSEEDYEDLEVLAESRNATPEDTLREGLKKLIDERVTAMEREFIAEKDKYIKLEDWARSKGLHK
jgi:hypothetical protein